VTILHHQQLAGHGRLRNILQVRTRQLYCGLDCGLRLCGYLMSPFRGKRDNNEDQFVVEFWQKVLQNEGISFKRHEPEWLDRSAMMQIPGGKFVKRQERGSESGER
jgi:hypothetical protein